MNNLVISLGTFDGIHRGHQRLLERLRQCSIARNAEPLVMAFSYPPRFRQGKEIGVLTLPKEKLVIFRRQGIERVLFLSFDAEMAKLPAHVFFQREIRERFAPVEIVVGKNFRFGHSREGDVPALISLGRDCGIRVEEVPLLLFNGHPVSSSRIRRHLTLGEIEEANRLLGYPYFVQGTVVKGDNRGRALGFPTANLLVAPEKILPPGVFIARVAWPAYNCLALVNVGTRPTFTQQNISLILEVHLLNFRDNLYGRELTVHFLTRIRAEQRFLNAVKLQKQIALDIAALNSKKHFFRNILENITYPFNSGADSSPSDNMSESTVATSRQIQK